MKAKKLELFSKMWSESKIARVEIDYSKSGEIISILMENCLGGGENTVENCRIMVKKKQYLIFQQKVIVTDLSCINDGF